MADPLARLKTVNVVRVHVPVSHPVIEENPGITSNQTGTPCALDALQLANRIAPPVHDHKAGGVLFDFGRSGDGTGFGGFRFTAILHKRPWVSGLYGLGCFGLVNLLCSLDGVFLGNQGRRRDVYEFRVGDISFPVDECQFLRFHHQVDALGAVAAQRFQVKLLHDVQFLEQDVSTGVWRCFIHRVALIRSRDGYFPTSPAVGHVLHSK